MGKSLYYTMEKLPNRKTYSLNRKERGILIPIAYFKKEKDAKRFLKEVKIK